MSLEDLKGEVVTLASHLHAGTCRWLELVGELDRRGTGPSRVPFVRGVARLALRADAARGA